MIRSDGHFYLRDSVFASQAALAGASEELHEQWYQAEISPLVGELRSAGFSTLRWQQRAPYH